MQEEDTLSILHRPAIDVDMDKAVPESSSSASAAPALLTTTESACIRVCPVIGIEYSSIDVCVWACVCVCVLVCVCVCVCVGVVLSQ
jgi:hypothetical protein